MMYNQRRQPLLPAFSAAALPGPRESGGFSRFTTMRTFLHCEKCHQILGETHTNKAGLPCIKIAFLERSQTRRIYIVSAVESVLCKCGHDGPPLPAAVAVEDKPASNKKLFPAY